MLPAFPLATRVILTQPEMFRLTGLMAKPRVFISSTFYDLRQIREDLDRFILDMGYEPVRYETGAIPYSKTESLRPLHTVNCNSAI